MTDEPHTLKFFDREARTVLQLFAELFGALFLLVLSGLLLREPLVHLRPGSVPFALAKLAPIVPVWLMLLAVVRHYFRIDEYQRLVFLQTVALTTGILLCVYWSYPYAQEVFALPPFPGIMSWPFTVVLLIVTVWFSRHRAVPRRG